MTQASVSTSIPSPGARSQGACSHWPGLGQGWRAVTQRNHFGALTRRPGAQPAPCPLNPGSGRHLLHSSGAAGASRPMSPIPMTRVTFPNQVRVPAASSALTSLPTPGPPLTPRCKVPPTHSKTSLIPQATCPPSAPQLATRFCQLSALETRFQSLSSRPRPLPPPSIQDTSHHL